MIHVSYNFSVTVGH